MLYGAVFTDSLKYHLTSHISLVLHPGETRDVALAQRRGAVPEPRRRNLGGEIARLSIAARGKSAISKPTCRTCELTVVATETPQHLQTASTSRRDCAPRTQAALSFLFFFSKLCVSLGFSAGCLIANFPSFSLYLFFFSSAECLNALYRQLR